MCLSNVDVHQGTVACNCFSSRKNSSCPDFFIKNILSNTRSEFNIVRRNTISIGQSGLVDKKSHTWAWLLNYWNFLLFLGV